MNTEKKPIRIRYTKPGTVSSQAKQDYPKSPWKRKFASVSRWLHIYVSMVSFAILLFFAATGITLNHASWFDGQQSTNKTKGKLNPLWVNNPDTAKIAKLDIVEYLRKAHAVKGAVSEFRIEEADCFVSFKGPGYSADVFINKSDGKFELTETKMGVVAVLNDLHKGRDTGKAWANVIDVSAFMMVLVSISGIILICFIKRKRFSGLLVAVAGTAICYLLYVLFVP